VVEEEENTRQLSVSDCVTDNSNSWNNCHDKAADIFQVVITARLLAKANTS
jgi:hypothetical protein